MSNDNMPDRIKATLTIELDFAKKDQSLMGEVLQNIINNLGMSSAGKGSRTKESHYTYKLESNVPSKPMTVKSLFDLYDQQREPGEPSVLEQLAETSHPHYDEACTWWESVTEPQQAWFNNTYPNVTLVTAAWEVYQNMDVATRTMFHALK